MSKKNKEQISSGEGAPKKKSKKKLWVGLGIGAAGVSVVAVVIALISVIVILVGILIGAAVYVWKVSDNSSVQVLPGISTDGNSDGIIISRPDGSISVILPDNSATVPTVAPSEQPEIGSEVGNLCPSDMLEIIADEAFTGEMIDPTSTGKVTVIYFWGTHLGVSLSGLSDLEKITRKYGDEIAVFAVHTSDLLEYAPSYSDKLFPDSQITFLADYEYGEEYDAFYSALGGAESGGVYPYTVILDEDGVILYKAYGTKPYDALEARIQGALKN